MCCPVVVIGVIHCVTGGMPVSFLGLFMRFIGVLWSLIGVISGLGSGRGCRSSPSR
jgi:hypothetical protein